MLISLIAVLSLFDIVLTGFGISQGYIHEGNPLMARLFEVSVVGTGFLVALVVGLSLWLIASQMDRFKWIRYAMFGVLAVKIAVTSLHINWLIQL